LSESDVEIIRELISEGKTNKEIAEIYFKTNLEIEIIEQ